MRKEKTITVGEKNFKIKEVPPIEALDHKLIEIAAKRYRVKSMDVFDARRVAYEFPITMMPRIGDYAENEKLFRLLMKYVEVEISPNNWQALTTDELIRQHVSPKDFARLEREVVDFTTGFFSDGNASNIVLTIGEFIIERITKTLMVLSAEFLKADKQLSEK